MPKDRRLATVCALFFLSGAAGLIYEVVWSRLFKDVFGVTAYAVAAVLATYLGGLALGSWALGRAADRPSDPLRLYGFLEIGVAATALAGLPAIHLFDPLHAAAAARLAPGSPAPSPATLGRRASSASTTEGRWRARAVHPFPPERRRYPFAGSAGSAGSAATAVWSGRSGRRPRRRYPAT